MLKKYAVISFGFMGLFFLLFCWLQKGGVINIIQLTRPPVCYFTG
jgi:uncharacterized membrane protein (Fun14 family)